MTRDAEHCRRRSESHFSTWTYIGNKRVSLRVTDGEAKA